MNNIFTVHNEDLGRLNPEDAVLFFQELLWSEAMRISLPLNRINISRNVFIPDEGIDANVSDGPIDSTSNIIKTGLTTYQIKAGEFEPWQSSTIIKEFFGRKKPNKDFTKDDLNNGIKETIEKNGTYILVCTSVDLTSTQQKEAVEHIKKHLKDICGYDEVKVEVWSQNNLRSFLKYFPSLSLKVNNREKARFQTHSSWANDAEMQRIFKPGDAQIKFIEDIRTELEKIEEINSHIRIIGEPGIGKTRLVFEATNVNPFKNLVIYANANIFKDSDLMNELLKEDNNFNVILILDECDDPTVFYLWDKFKYRNNRIKLITIYNEKKSTIGDLLFFEAPLLDDSKICEIIVSYEIPLEKASSFSYLCSGSPRVAHVLGLNLRNNPLDITSSPDTVDIWGRYIAGYERSDKEYIRKKMYVLKYISLFKRFGYEDGSKDFEYIVSIIEKKNPSITSDVINEIISELKRRKILQGQYVLYITPKLLHIWLWCEWWKDFRVGFDMEKFSEGLSENLKDSFLEMFQYSKNSNASKEIVDELLSERGPFRNDVFLKSKRGADFFLTLSKVNPEAALKRLVKLFENKPNDYFLNFPTRRQIVWMLEYTGQFKNMFNDSIKLLIRLADTENEKWANNATNIFKGFFALGMGQLAPTETPPLERLEIIKDLLKSPDHNLRKLSLEALNSSLHEVTHRSVGIEGQAFTKTPHRWKPQKWQEIFDALSASWNLIIDSFNKFNNEERQIALKILSNNLSYLIRYPSLSKMIIESIKKIVCYEDVDKRIFIQSLVRSLNWLKRSKPPGEYKNWQDLLDFLSGTDFKSKLKRYVSMNLWEDELNDEDTHKNNADTQIDLIAQEIVKDPSVLNPEYAWIMSKEAVNGYKLGYNIGKKDTESSLIDIFIEQQKKIKENRSLYFLSGYFRALYEVNKVKFENLIIELSKSEETREWILVLSSNTYLTDKILLNITQFLKDKKLEFSELNVFHYGTALEYVSENVFLEFINVILEQKKFRNNILAMDFVRHYYLRAEETKVLPKNLTYNLLKKTIYSKERKINSIDPMEIYNWEDLCEKFLKQYPKEKKKIYKILLDTYSLEGSVSEQLYSKVNKILLEITAEYPLEIWSYIKDIFATPKDKRAYYLTQWLRGGDQFGGFHADNEQPALDLIPKEEVWKWIDEDIENRAWYVASFVPNKFFREANKVCYAREILVTYGNLDSVKRNLMANFGTGGWSGPGSVYYTDKKNLILEFKKDETNANVINWIDEYVENLDYNIKREKIEEERFDRF
ncbi:MAG: hypothetical protein K1X86_10155 [Ignavibacteria bacterium]|nr:hypothetical protein [Ignavibacteria bacterium]